MQAATAAQKLRRCHGVASLAPTQFLDSKLGTLRRRVELHLLELAVLHGRHRDIRVRGRVTLDTAKDAPVLPVHSGEANVLGHDLPGIARIEREGGLLREGRSTITAVLAPEEPPPPRGHFLA